MSFRSTGLAGVILISLMLLGCVTNPFVSRPDLWQVQKERQQRLAREAGRIGYIGNAGPALGTSLPSSSQ
jgi:hypothetical protein